MDLKSSEIRSDGSNPNPKPGQNHHIPILSYCGLAVSIHAPARARRLLLVKLLAVPVVSIHAPARARLRQAHIPGHGSCCFNPRAREGATHISHGVAGGFVVSIHAPARARLAIFEHQSKAEVFQSTRPRGRDTRFMHPPSTSNAFQSTRPRGRDVDFIAASFVKIKFQSTRPRGRDPRRATCSRRPSTSFNPRAREGATGRLIRSPRCC